MDRVTCRGGLMLAGLWNEGLPFLEDFSSRDKNMYNITEAIVGAVHIPSCLLALGLVCSLIM